MARENKLVTRVGSIITPCQDEEEDCYDGEDSYSTSGWLPSSAFC